MPFTFSKGTTVILSDGTTSRELLVESVTANQTFLEESRSVKTVHVPNNIQDTFTNEKSSVTLEMTCYLTKTDSMLLEWFGLASSNGKFLILPSGQLLPTLSIYIKSLGSTYLVSNTYATNLVFRLDKDKPLSVVVSATGRDLTPAVAPIPTSRQANSEFIYGTLEVDGYSYVGGVTCELTKTISWVEDKTIHAILTNIYKVNKAVCTELAVGGSITNYKRDDSLSYNNTSGVVDIEYAGVFKLHFDRCKLLDRWDLSSEVHRKITDYKLLPTSGDAYFMDQSNPPAFFEFILDSQGF